MGKQPLRRRRDHASVPAQRREYGKQQASGGTWKPKRVLDSPLATRTQQQQPAPGNEAGLGLGHTSTASASVGDSSVAAASAGATLQQQPTEDDNMANLINLSFTMARELSRSLTDSSAGNSSFENSGAGIFAHGALGIVVQITDKSGNGVDPSSITRLIASQSLSVQAAHDLLKRVANLCLHIDVDGVDDNANRRITACAREQIDAHKLPTRFLPKQIFAFGPKLIQFAEAQRAAGEAQYGSADGIADRPTASPTRNTRRVTRHAAFKARLQEGGTVQWRSGGDSLAPRIKSHECCKYKPVRTHEDVNENDIVFCQIRQRYWQHMVQKTYVGGDRECTYTISNIKGHENGTITLQHIYGKLIAHWP